MTELVPSFVQMNVTRINIRKVLEVQSIQNQELMHSSKGKDIVVFVGRTGAGKSTLINYLVEKELTVDQNDNIVLKNLNDPSAMVVGVSDVSETLLPKFIECNQFLLYDLPGFGDTRGTAVNLVNAAFIKNIIENAETVRIVFVIGQDEITAGRGELIKQLMLSLKTLIPNESIEEISALVVTKSSANRNIEQLVEKLKEKTEGDTVTKWFKVGRLAKMESAYNNRINEDDRKCILNTIINIKKKRITTVNIGAIISYSDQNTIKSIYIDEMQEIFDRFLLSIIDTTAIEALSLPYLEDKINQLNRSIDECQFNGSTLIPLLRTISSDVYDLALIEFKKITKSNVEKIVSSIVVEIKERQRIKAEKDLKEEANKRLLAEQQHQQHIQHLQNVQNQLMQTLREQGNGSDCVIL